MPKAMWNGQVVAESGTRQRWSRGISIFLPAP